MENSLVVLHHNSGVLYRLNWDKTQKWRPTTVIYNVDVDCIEIQHNSGIQCRLNWDITPVASNVDWIET